MSIYNTFSCLGCKAFVAGVLCCVVSAFAQTAITSISTTTLTGTPEAVKSEGGIVFDNTVIRMDAFSTGTQTYAVTRLADTVNVLRNESSPNQSSVWYRTKTSGSEPIGVHYDNYGALLISNNLASGSENTFANEGSTMEIGNIERLDFIFSSPLAASSNIGFAVFDLGDANDHDQFKIAAITELSGSTVTSYGKLIGPESTWGSKNLSIGKITSFDYRLFRYGKGDDISASTENTEVGKQGLAGLMYTMADLGIPEGTKVFGYSLFGYDVTSSGKELLDIANYPTTTDPKTGGGGIDLLAVNGIAFTLIPEPSTYALCGMGTMAAFAAWWRRRQRCKSVRA
ncbi:MAG: PEP-CTERM sorting domain-containing protein [Opitutaceae bacterium]|jgi:hypothetical protein